MCEFLWSDPEEINDWEANPRGAGVIFGSQLVDKFLRTNNIVFIVRAHQLIMEGYRNHFNGKLYTVWSAPNYCYRCNNMAAIMKLNANLKPEFDTFKASAEDYKPAPKKKDLPEYFL
jgi:serine/threonine-protein phosphatase 4 catalytic subunit